MSLLCWTQPKGFSFSAALLQLSSDSALTFGFPGFLRQGIGLQGGPQCLRWCGVWWVVCTLLWAGTVAPTLAVLLTGIQETWGGVGALSCPSPGSPGQGTDTPQTLQVVGSWLGRIFVSAHPAALPASLAPGALVHLQVLCWPVCIIPSRGSLGNHVPPKQGHVLLSWETSATNIALF